MGKNPLAVALALLLFKSEMTNAQKYKNIYWIG